MRTLTSAELDQAKLDPASVFDRPKDVLSTSLPVDDKTAILRRWEADADELIQASDDGMRQADPSQPAGELLAAVQAALETLAGH